MAELFAKGCMKAKYFHGSGKTEQLHEKVSSSSHFSVNSIKSSPPLNRSLFKYDNVKAFYNPQRRKYSVNIRNLSQCFQSLKKHCSLKGNRWTSPISVKCEKKKKKKNPFFTCNKELQRDQSTDRKPGPPEHFEIKSAFLKPKNICKTEA